MRDARVAISRQFTPVPSLTIAGVRYLPMLHYRLTPYGREWSIVNELAGRIMPTQIELRIGRAPRMASWGVGLRGHDLANWRGWSLGASVDLWRQPRLIADIHGPPATAARIGGQAGARIQRPILPVWFSTTATTMIVDLGVKSEGFVPGEPLRGGIVVRAGVGLSAQRLARRACA